MNTILIKCKICSDNINRLSFANRHLPLKHNINGKEYYDKYLKKPGEGICKYCENETKFKKFSEGYGDYCSKACSSRGTRTSTSEKIGASKRENNWEIFVDKLKNKKINPLFTKDIYITKKKELFKFKCEQCNTVFVRNNNRETFKTGKIKCHHKTNTKNNVIKKPLNLLPMQERRKLTNMKIYGYDNPAKHPDIKKKMANTNMSKFGHKAPAGNKLVQKTISDTNFNRFGTKSPAENSSVKNKIKKRHKEISGYDNIFQSPKFKIQNKKYYNENYDCDYASQVPEFIEKTQKSKRKKYWNIYALKLKLKKIKPLFDADFYINEEEFEFKCLRDNCNKTFKSTKTEAYSINCGCLKRSSKYEHEIVDELKRLDIKKFDRNEYYYNNDHHRYKKLELDIYLPDYNLGIEYCGFYHHCEARRPDDYHINKYHFFKGLEIPTIQIFENEWIDKQDIVMSIIKGKLNKLSSIYARKCEVKTVPIEKYQEFMVSNHLQGSVPASIKLGLYYNNELVSVMSLGKSRFDKKYEYEIIRFANKLGLNVTGGFSKLLKYFERNYNPKSLISYVDARYFNGASYKKTNFIYSHHSTPAYKYFKNNTRELHNRVKFQKHKLKKILDIFDENKTEHENMLANKYYRIYDAGNLVYIKKY